MPFWTGKYLRANLERLFKADTFCNSEDVIDKAAYNLRLGKGVFLSSGEAPLALTDEQPYVTIRPGDYVLLTTYEYLTMPRDLLGFITLRYTFKKHGLMNVSGFHVDPGFHGRLVFSVFNVGTNDVVLRFLEPMFMLFVASLREEIEPKKGKHDGQECFSLDDVIAIRGRSASLVQMESRIKNIETNVNVYGTIVIGALIVLFALVVTLVHGVHL
jgi:dCTP deaminase